MTLFHLQRQRPDHHIDADPDELYIGMPMQVVLEPKAKREGLILDITGFKPAE